MSETDAMSIIEAAFSELSGKRILDVGCGKGALARSLSARGARVVGVDPNGEALKGARQTAPTAEFRMAGAETLPFADRTFDGVIFLNSLHHVLESDMRRALLEAARVVSAGPVIVIEPLAEGSLFSVLRLVEDETDVRAAAQEAVREALEDGTFEQLDRSEYVRRDLYADVDEFLSHVVSVNPSRAEVARERRAEIEAAFLRHAQVTDDGGMTLEQPIRAHVMAATV